MVLVDLSMLMEIFIKARLGMGEPMAMEFIKASKSSLVIEEILKTTKNMEEVSRKRHNLIFKGYFNMTKNHKDF